MCDNENALTYDPTKEFEFQCQVGSQIFPVYAMKSASEMFTHLKMAGGIHYSAFHSFDINSKEYYTNKFILALNFETELSRAFTGMNTRAGDQISLFFTNIPGVTTVQVLLHYDCIVNLRDEGVEYFE